MRMRIITSLLVLLSGKSMAQRFPGGHTLDSCWKIIGTKFNPARYPIVSTFSPSQFNYRGHRQLDKQFFSIAARGAMFCNQPVEEVFISIAADSTVRGVFIKMLPDEAVTRCIEEKHGLPDVTSGEEATATGLSMKAWNKGAFAITVTTDRFRGEEAKKTIVKFTPVLSK